MEDEGQALGRRPSKTAVMQRQKSGAAVPLFKLRKKEFGNSSGSGTLEVSARSQR